MKKFNLIYMTFADIQGNVAKGRTPVRVDTNLNHSVTPADNFISMFVERT